MPLNPFKSKPVKGFESARDRYIENNPNARIASPAAQSQREKKAAVEAAKAVVSACHMKAEAKGKKGCIKKGASYKVCSKHSKEGRTIAAGYR